MPIPGNSDVDAALREIIELMRNAKEVTTVRGPLESAALQLVMKENPTAWAGIGQDKAIAKLRKEYHRKVGPDTINSLSLLSGVEVRMVVSGIAASRGAANRERIYAVERRCDILEEKVKYLQSMLKKPTL